MNGTDGRCTFIYMGTTTTVFTAHIIGMAITNAMAYFMCKDRSYGIDIPGIEIGAVHTNLGVWISTGRETGRSKIS